MSNEAPTTAPREMKMSDARCFACGRKIRNPDSVRLAHVAGDGEQQNVYVGPECHDQMQMHRAPWQPPKGGPKLLPGRRRPVTYVVMRHFHQTWTDPGEDEPVSSEYATREEAEADLADREGRHPHRSFWIAQMDEAGDLMEGEA